MTLVRPTLPTPSSHPAVALTGDIRARLRQEDVRARLDEILRAVVVDALAPGAAGGVAGGEWVGVEDAIRTPVAAATSAALERLAADLEVALPREVPVAKQRLRDERLRAELGYD